MRQANGNLKKAASNMTMPKKKVSSSGTANAAAAFASRGNSNQDAKLVDSSSDE